MTDTTKPPSIPRRFTERREVRHWGETCYVKPAVAKSHLGDGKQLVWFQPLNTRPDYYLIRVDSSWFGDDEDCDVTDDRVEEFISALEDEFGEKDSNEDRLGWPALSLDSGYCWNVVAKFNGKQWR